MIFSFFHFVNSIHFAMHLESAVFSKIGKYKRVFEAFLNERFYKKCMKRFNMNVKVNGRLLTMLKKFSKTDKN